MTNRNNSYDLLRLILATFVLISHSFYMLEFPYTDIGYFLNGQTYLGEVGLLGFFTLSGYLITKSFFYNESAVRFFKNRIFRIFPGFWFCLIFTAFIIGPTLFYIEKNTLNNYPYSGPWSAINYIKSNFFLEINQSNIRNVLDTI